MRGSSSGSSRRRDFRTGGPKPSTARAIARRMGGAYAAVVFAVMTGVALMAAELVTATFAPLFVDQILVAERRQWIRPLLLAMGLDARSSGC